MTDNDVEAFSQLIKSMVESFGREATRGQINGFWWMLSPFELRTVTIAVYRAMEMYEQLPVPGQVLKLCRDMTSKATRRRYQNSEADVFRAVLAARASGKNVEEAIDDARQRVTDEKNAQRRKDNETLGIDVWT